LGSYHHLELLDVVGWILEVQDGVAVRTHRNQISLRVNAIGRFHPAERTRVVDVDEPSRRLTVSLLEVKTTGLAFDAMVANTRGACLEVSLEAVDRYPFDGSLRIVKPVVHLAERSWPMGRG